MRGHLLVIALFLHLRILATHIVGGELMYDYLGNDKYRVTLKIYRDCAMGTAFLDGVAGTPPAILSVIEPLNSLNSYTVNIGTPVITQIPPTINNPCIKTPTNICVQEGIYTYTLTLPPKTGGYYLVYQRCCRNNSVLNLLNSGNQGSTYYTKVPGPEEAVDNNSPRFKNFPPIFLCNNLDFSFDHSATDPDGDQLVYSLCPPFIGMDGCCNYIGDPGSFSSGLSCPSPPSNCPNIAALPPYAPVAYISPYSGSYPIASNPLVTINAATGMLTGKPNLIGQFVVGVCVQELRNGIVINTHYRDFQFNISPCVVSVASAVAEQKQQCLGNTITFTNQSTSNVGNLSYHWDFGVATLTNDTSNLVHVTYTFPDTGKYELTLIATPPGKVCADTLKRVVYVYPPLLVDFARPQRQCFKNNSFAFKARGTYLPAHIKFEWNFTPSGSPNVSVLQNPDGVTFNQPGLFFVKLVGKQFSCRDSFVDSVRVLKRPKAKIEDPPGKACDPATLWLRNGSVSDLPLTYAWSFDNGGVYSKEYEPTVTFPSAGVYKIRLTVTTASLCVDTSVAAVKYFTVSPSPTAGFVFSPEVASVFEPEITVTSNVSYDAQSWRYSFGDGDSAFIASPVHVYGTFGEYTITQVVINAYGCRDTTSQIVQVLPEFRFWIPNTFSPDGNALNDIYKPSLYGITDYKFEIFDRWGKKIFETIDPEYGWDGLCQDTECKQDIYNWRIVYKNTVSQKKEVRLGHVLLMRNR